MRTDLEPTIRPFLAAAVLASPVLVACASASSAPQPPPPPPPPGMVEGRLSVQVEVENGGPPRIVVDGREVPDSRIERMPDGSIRIRSEDGSRVIHVINPPRGGGPEAAAPTERPMIGLMLGPVDPLLARHLRLDPGSTSVIVGVMPGSPAAEAGLVEGDLLASVEDGPADMDRLHRLTAGGEEVTLVVIHEGERRTLAVRPRMMAMPVPMPPDAPRSDLEGPPPGSWEDMRRALERFGSRTSEDLRRRMDEWRDRWEGPWAEEHVRRPIRELRDTARREFQRLVEEMEERERRLQERLEDRLRRLQEEMREQTERVERELREAWSRRPVREERPMDEGPELPR